MSADLDLIALVPDLDWEHTLRTVLGLFSELASKASLTRCADASFRRLADVLVNWFPPI